MPSTPPVASSNLKVDPLPQGLLKKFEELGCCAPNQCFRNAGLLVTNHELAQRYVLCFVSQEGAQEVAHAIVKIGNAYYDPTLQSQNLKNLQYRFHSEYTRQEVQEMVMANQVVEAIPGGFAEVYPPVLKSNGAIVYEPTIGPFF